MISKGLGGGLTGKGALGAMSSAYLQSQGVDPSVLSDPNPKNIATTALAAYLTSLGVPPQLSGPLAETAVNTITSGELPKVDVKDLFNGDAIKGQLLDAAKGYLAEQGIDPTVADKMMNDIMNSAGALGDIKDLLKGGGSLPSVKIDDPTAAGFKVEETVIVPTEVKLATKDAPSEEPDLKGVARSAETYQRVNEAVDIDRFLKDGVYGFLPPMNWWDMMPDWPAFSYEAIIADQTRAAKKKVLEGIDPPDETEFEIASHKFPYKTKASSVLQKGMVTPGSRQIILGHELLQLAEDKDTVQDTKSKVADVTKGTVSETTQVNSKYRPLAPFPFIPFPNVYRDDLTDQKNPALDLVDTQKLVDEFLAIGQRIYDQQTENPTIFGFDNVVSQYEKDKNIVLANYKQYKVNVRKMEHINNIVESKSNNYLIENIPTRYDIPNCSTAEEWGTRYLREKLLAWYHETADPDTKIWTNHHWLPGEPGYIVYLLTVGNWEWYNNLVAGLEDSVARLEDLEATLDLLSSMANVVGTWKKYQTALEVAELKVETPNWDFENTVTFTDEIIDQTMLKELLGVSEIIGAAAGKITSIRSELRGLRWSNQAILDKVRKMSPITLSYPIIWTKLQTMCARVNSDIKTYLNTLILNKRGDQETAGWHSSPSHLMLDISKQLANICKNIEGDVKNIIDTQKALPKMGKYQLDSMLNKINEIRMKGPLCGIPWHYWMAIDNVNAAERLYNDIWSDVFDCWEREYIIRNWKILVEHHKAGVIPNSHYGKPLFSAECPHHLPMLLAPIPVDYRDIDICYLSANCRKNFNGLTSWLTSALYAIGVKRTALAAVINDTSLNGNDENEPWLTMLCDLNAKNIIIKEEIENAIKSYNGTKPLLQKADLDKIIAAKELSPTHYSNQTLLNMSSELHLLNTWPVTVLDLASNENRTGTVVSNSPALKWETVSKTNETEVAASDAIEVTTIPTTGGPSEIVIDTGVSSDSDNSTKSMWVGDVDEFEPWFYMTPDWDTRRALKDPPIVVPPETSPVIPEPPVVEMPDVAEHPDNPAEDVKLTPEVISSADQPLAPKSNNYRIMMNEEVSNSPDPLVKVKTSMMDSLLDNISKVIENQERLHNEEKHT